ncbi:thioredoxin domain-containing protein [uncultured Thermanaerothrix sp.]|uniref:DsbA family protein n=1 Tax=uncultured Thermanaerothrix sp. TaxID=1195149 RepID=UPI00263482CD|nr:thioredoxin domain-containing protein [uncultured Thermanaerothrix sp.]
MRESPPIPASPDLSRPPAPTIRRRPAWHWGMVGFGLAAFLLGVAAGYGIWGREVANLRAQLSAQQAEADVPRQVTRYDVPVDDDPALGPANAPITIIEFSDFQCPYCQRWHVQVWPKIQAAYGDKVRLVYRDFPLYSIHPEAAPAAEAANCANEQGKFWEFHDLLFRGGLSLGREAYLAYAERLGLKMDQFTTCLDERRYQAEVEGDYAYAVDLGINSTPTFFINGIALLGAQPFEVFQRVIELELAGKLSQ